MWYYADSAGYNRAQAQQVAREAEIAKRFVAVIDERTKKRDAALELVDTLRARPPEVITQEITKYVENSDCKRLDADIVRLLNGSTAN